MVLKISEIETALRASSGVVTAAASELCVTRQALQKRITRSAHLQAVVKDITEGKLDLAELVIYREVARGDAATARWMLDRKGRDRGWGPKHEVTGDGGDPLNVKLSVETLTDEQFELLEKLRAAAGEGPIPRS
jgi:hypothetical protein